MRRMILAGVLALGLAGGAQAREVTDLAGRRVEVPATVRRVACLEVLCYPRMAMLGAAARIVIMDPAPAPWVRRTNPRVAAIPVFRGSASLEEILAARPDVVFLNAALDPQALARLAAAGIPALVSQPVRPPATALDFAADSRAMVLLFGRVLGGEAERRAEAWCAYFDERVHFVESRVAALPEDRRPRLYYVRGPRALSTQGRGGYTTWIGTMAGARMVVDRSAIGNKGEASMEELVRWDPQVIVVGRQYSLGVVLDDPRWRDIAALRDRRVYPSPVGVFYWDGGPEQVLLLQYLAKLLHPDLFADLDMVAEVKGYYARFYGTALSDAEAALLLAGRSPDGSRHNSLND